MEAMKAKEKEMKDEKEAERKVCAFPLTPLPAPRSPLVPVVFPFALRLRVMGEGRGDWIDVLTKRLQRRTQAIKDKRAAKAEKERYELLEAKMHRKRVERLKRREKRNKLLNS